MNCEHVQRVLDAYLDGELDPATLDQVRDHLAGCTGCRGLRTQRDALRAALRRSGRHEMPAALRARVDRALDRDAAAAVPASTPRPARWAAAAWGGAAAALAFALGVWVGTPSAPPDPPDLREQAIAQHVASFDAGTPRLQVASSDRHVVKPWFAGRLDLAPPVRDLTAQGFTLVGGRLDRLGAQSAAVLVYQIRRHQISLFVARAQSGVPGPVQVSTLRGFATATWVHDGLALVAVSDLDARELQRFVDAVRAAAP